MKTICLVFGVFSAAWVLSGCVATEPALMYKKLNGSASLGKHSSSSIYVEPAKTVCVILHRAYFPKLPELSRGRGRRVHETAHLKSSRHRAEVTQNGDDHNIIHGRGNREIIIFAEVYANGTYQKSILVSDLTEHQTESEFATITKPKFFTETINEGHYKIIPKAFEIDSKHEVKTLRYADSLKLDEIEGEWNFGKSLVDSTNHFLKGAVGIPFALTGRTLDGMVAKVNADKIFEHSLYIVPTAKSNGFIQAADGDVFPVIANSRSNRFIETEDGLNEDPYYNQILGWRQRLNEQLVTLAVLRRTHLNVQFEQAINGDMSRIDRRALPRTVVAELAGITDFNRALKILDNQIQELESLNLQDKLEKLDKEIDSERKRLVNDPSQLGNLPSDQQKSPVDSLANKLYQEYRKNAFMIFQVRFAEINEKPKNDDPKSG